ncbi:MAG: cytochrome ubiquinol oxidase subunit I [Paludibacterium sp.]|uniref:cytochrome ubiquinol oxidase subunit I n=1 Tax=Paludibacterium sp. TaxID=1917523 RepID=UPI0025FEAB90|nr:cytochrome ubiquinol oxidase subunit I [Paludibacterium sp.]MBV8047593.1 cytochrome ubiquinol oxidase subunit I [Paludibacterium sp.]MBV8646890.1 cytochrome ubiquinol oxidase subunit I [Paludibacterium sp.]
MISLDVFFLARAQFAVNIAFHTLFTTISIALAWVLFYFRLRGQQACWRAAYGFWVKIFALTFALGVVSGVAMSFQFGTNWPGFMNYAGNVAGPLLTFEVLTAFFLESTFLGLMLFGAGRVSQTVQTVAVFLVALGTTLSAFWILALNAWMHTPDGYMEREGVLHARDWWRIVFNPAMPWHVAHMLLASGLTVAFLLAGLSAYRWLRGQHDEPVRVVMTSGVRLAAWLIPLQIWVGDLHGLQIHRDQPAKVAAIEGLWHTGRAVPAVIWGWPDERAGRIRGALALPGVASLILTHDWDGEIQGLEAFAERPPVLPVFLAFRVMVGMAIGMWLVAWIGAWHLRGRRAPSPRLVRWLIGMTFSGWIAVLAGWCVTEIGRQPYLIQGLLLTRAAAADMPSAQLALSLGGYLALALGLLAAYVTVLFLLARRPDAPLLETPVPVLPIIRQGEERPHG